MLPFLFMVTAPQRRPQDFVRHIAGAFYSVLEKYHVSRESAAEACGFKSRQRLEESLKHGGNISRFMALPDLHKRDLWQLLKPFFGYAASEADNPELEQRIADLEADKAREAKEREALQTRFDELERIVRRLDKPAADVPHEVRKTA